MLDALAKAAQILDPAILLSLFIGCLSGIVIGALPGLTATMAVSLLVSLTYGMDATAAIAVLIAVYLGGIYGGSRSAILLNVPGTPSSAATALDGFPLARKGEGEVASHIATLGSAGGGMVGLVILFVATPLIADAALRFGVWEYFWLAMFGVVISANLTSGSVVKGLISGLLGLLFSCIGLDGIHATPRLIFGNRDLMAGISIVPAMIGLFGLGEALYAIGRPESHTIEQTGRRESLWQGTLRAVRIITPRWRNFLRSSIIGTFIGALPGVGPDIASWTAYGSARRASRNPDEFGKGSYDGVLASETANNAATSGVFIPLLTLGIPGCAVTAVIIGAMRLHGLRPGPTFFFETPEMVGFIVAALLVTNILIIVQGVGLTGVITKVLQAPVQAVMPVVVVFAVIGAYAVGVRWFDVTVMIFFGLLGLAMRYLNIPAAPMALGIILGPLADLNFRRGLYAGHFSMAPFFTRPVSIMLIVGLLAMTLGPRIVTWLRARRRNDDERGGQGAR